MRIVVDLNRCQGYAQCVPLAPDVLKLNGDEALSYDPNPDDTQRLRVLRAAASCPVQAILVDELDSDKRASADDSGWLQRQRPDRHRRRFTGRAARRRGVAGGGFSRAADNHRRRARRAYDRPPLSKQVLEGLGAGRPHEAAAPARGRRRVATRRGRDRPGSGKRLVRLADGSEVPVDRLLIATGVRARRWPNAEEAALDGVYTLRTSDDAARLQEALAARPRRVLIIGAGFIGSEVASVCRELGLEVTVTERGAAPLAGALGGVIGAIAAEMQRDAGVDLRTGVSVPALEGDAERARAARPALRRQHARRRPGRDVARVDPQRRVARGAPGWRPGSGGSAATPDAAPSTSTGWSPITSSWPATSRAPRTCSTSTSSSRWSTGTTPCWAPRSPRTIWCARRSIAGRTC